MTVRRRAALVLAVALLIGGCTASTVTPTTTPSGSRSASGWHEIDPPQRGARVLVLIRLGAGLLALGSVPGTAIQGSSDRAPGAWLTRDLRTWTRIPTRSTTGYGELAEFVRGGAYGGRISVFGNATGGAHGSPRPTIWTGDRTGLREHAQSFTTFGGAEAISQTGEAVGAGGSLITGQWEGRTGYGAAVWTSPDGADWQRRQDVPGLAPSKGEQTTARGAAPVGRRFLVVGDNQTSSGSTQALTWTSSGPSRWHRTHLPSPGGATAARATCRRSSCVVVGSRVSAAPRLMCWTVAADGTHPAVGPLGPGAPLLEPAALVDAGARIYAEVQTDHDARVVSVGPDCRGWRTLPLPARSPSAAIGVLGTRMMLATTTRTASRLWVGPLR